KLALNRGLDRPARWCPRCALQVSGIESRGPHVDHAGVGVCATVSDADFVIDNQTLIHPSPDRVLDLQHPVVDVAASHDEVSWDVSTSAQLLSKQMCSRDPTTVPRHPSGDTDGGAASTRRIRIA